MIFDALTIAGMFLAGLVTIAMLYAANRQDT